MAFHTSIDNSGFKIPWSSVSNLGFPKLESHFFDYFLLPETRDFFNYQTQVLGKTWN